MERDSGVGPMIYQVAGFFAVWGFFFVMSLIFH